VFLAGCSGGDSGAANGTASGTFRLLVSDQPIAIEDFDSLDVTLSTARLSWVDADEEIRPGVANGTATGGATPTPDSGTEGTEDSGGEGVIEFDLDGAAVGPTQVKGERAVSVLEDELGEGRYSGVELQVANGKRAVDGETVEVMVE
jgi:hypothetical protein